jgi:hypothetical protein
VDDNDSENAREQTREIGSETSANHRSSYYNDDLRGLWRAMEQPTSCGGRLHRERVDGSRCDNVSRRRVDLYWFCSCEEGSQATESSIENSDGSLATMLGQAPR